MSKRGKKPVKRVNDIDEFLKKEFDNITKTTKSKPLVKASEVKTDAIVRPPVKKMMKFVESSDPPPFIQKKEKRERKEKTPAVKLPENPDEIYEEDFEEFVDEPPKKKEYRSSSHKRSPSSPDYSLETLKKDLEKENAAALKKEEEVSGETSVVQFSIKSNTTDYVDPKAIAKQQKRNKDIPELVKLEKESFSIFELLPLTQLDNHMGKVKQGELKNTGTQYNEDNVDKEIQPQEVITTEVATQWPGDMGKDSDIATQNSTIAKFLNKVSPMIEILLEENLENKPNKVNIKKSEGSAGEVISQTGIPAIDFLKPRFPINMFEVKDLVFFPSKKNFLCAQYSLLEYGSLIVIWDILSPSKPNRLLYSVNEITCVCMSSSKEHIVIAGNSIGSLELWDLREAGAAHELFKIDEKKKVSIRSPTYSTDSIEIYTHEGKILKIIELPAAKGENFSILVIDSEGNLVTWSIIEMINSDIEEFDLGLRIGGRVKMAKTHRTSIRELFPKNKTSACSSLALDLSDGQKFLYASPNTINYGNRFGMDTFPSNFAKIGAEATSISFASFNMYEYFLVGFSCGSLSFYSKNYSKALMNWVDCVGSIVKVGWDVSGRCGFFTIDKQQSVSVWDLKKASSGPVCKIQIDTPPWTAVDWVLPESSKHSMIVATAFGGEIRILNLNVPRFSSEKFDKVIERLPMNIM